MLRRKKGGGFLVVGDLSRAGILLLFCFAYILRGDGEGHLSITLDSQPQPA